MSKYFNNSLLSSHCNNLIFYERIQCYKCFFVLNIISVFVLEEKSQTSKHFTAEIAYRVSAKCVCLYKYISAYLFKMFSKSFILL